MALVLVALAVLSWAVIGGQPGHATFQGRVQAGAGALALDHPEGGLVAEVLVAEGDRVLPGAILLRLDDPVVRAERAITDAQRHDAATRVARHRNELSLLTERADQETDHALPEVSGTATEAILAAVAALRDATLAAGSATGTAAQLQVLALARQRAALIEQGDLIQQELDTQTRLLDQGLAQAGRSLALRREAARLAGLLAEIDAQEARLALARHEAEAARGMALADRRRQAAEALAQAEAQLAQAAVRLTALDAREAALELRATEAAIVQDIRVRPGQHLPPRAPALWLVPDAAPVIVTQLPDSWAGTVLPGQVIRFQPPAESGAAPAPAQGAKGIVHSVAAEARPEAPGRPAVLRVVITPADTRDAARLSPGQPVRVIFPRASGHPLTRLGQAFSPFVRPGSTGPG